jgi:hypothetical protein
MEITSRSAPARSKRNVVIGGELLASISIEMQDAFEAREMRHRHSALRSGANRWTTAGGSDPPHGRCSRPQT